jgi:hypothetical protein
MVGDIRVKWTRAEADDKSSEWQESPLTWGVERFDFVFVVEHINRDHCWLAYLMVYDADLGIGEYATERLAKAACRRKAGRIVDSLKRGIRA